MNPWANKPNDQGLTYVELSFFSKTKKKIYHGSHKRSFTKLDSKKGKRFETKQKEKENSLAKNKIFFCFNYERIGHLVVDCPYP